MAAPKKPKPQDDMPKDEGIGTPTWEDVEDFRKVRAQQIWSYDDTGFDLTVEEALFVRSYIIDRNEVSALRRLNYAGDVGKLKRIAAKHLANTEVLGAIETLAKQMMAKLEITAEKVQQRIAAVAFFDPRSVMSFDEIGVTLLKSRFWTEDQALNIKSVKMGATGLEIQFHDGLRAAELLSKQLNLQPEDNAFNSKEAAEAGAAAAINKMVDAFIRIKELDPDEVDRRRAQRALPAPEKLN